MRNYPLEMLGYAIKLVAAYAGKSWVRGTFCFKNVTTQLLKQYRSFNPFALRYRRAFPGFDTSARTVWVIA